MAREFSKRAPLLALVLLLSLGGGLVWHSARMRALRGQLKTQLASWEATKAELLQQTVRPPGNSRQHTLHPAYMVLPEQSGTAMLIAKPSWLLVAESSARKACVCTEHCISRKTGRWERVILSEGGVHAQRAMDSSREMANARARHAETMRTELENTKLRLRTAEDDSAHKQGIITHNNHQARMPPDMHALVCPRSAHPGACCSWHCSAASAKDLVIRRPWLGAACGKVVCA